MGGAQRSGLWDLLSPAVLVAGPERARTPPEGYSVAPDGVIPLSAEEWAELHRQLARLNGRGRLDRLGRVYTIHD